MLLTFAWVIAANLALFCLYRRARRRRIRELWERRLNEAGPRIQVTLVPREVMELRDRVG